MALACLGSQMESRVYNPHEKIRFSNGEFIGYLEKTKGYKVYYPNHSSRITEWVMQNLLRMVKLV